MPFLEYLAGRIGLDPFEYLLISIGGMFLWIWCSAIGGFALTGRGIWLRWGSIALAFFGAVMFAVTARMLN
ncbi:MAG: hypothetical protein ABI629_13645 [bacterium]